MSRKANPYDNAIMESFFATLKTECLQNQIPKSRREAKLILFDYIETFYNRYRLHSSLGYQSPLEFESNFTKPNNSLNKKKPVRVFEERSLSAQRVFFKTMQRQGEALSIMSNPTPNNCTVRNLPCATTPTIPQLHCQSRSLAEHYCAGSLLDLSGRMPELPSARRCRGITSSKKFFSSAPVQS